MTTLSINWQTFRQIPNYSAYYVSDTGEIYSTITNKILRNQIDRHGYHVVNIKNDLGEKKTVRVHRVLLQAWIGMSDLEVCHLDDDKTNNRITNLVYQTHSFNMTMNAMKPYKRLSDDDLKEMHALYKLFHGRGRGSISALAERFDCSVTAARKHLRPVTEQRRAKRLAILKSLRGDLK